MPIFEYTCRDCGKSCELIVRSSEKPVCEHCGSRNLHKNFSVFSAHAAKSEGPACAGGCEGFRRGACGSGMCGGH